MLATTSRCLNFRVARSTSCARLLRLGDVGDLASHVPANGGDGIDGGGQFLLAMRSENDPGSPGRQQPGGCRAYTVPGTGDRHNFPGDLAAFRAGHEAS
jgi:hypothetical protein